MNPSESQQRHSQSYSHGTCSWGQVHRWATGPTTHSHLCSTLPHSGPPLAQRAAQWWCWIGSSTWAWCTGGRAGYRWTVLLFPAPPQGKSSIHGLVGDMWGDWGAVQTRVPSTWVWGWYCSSKWDLTLNRKWEAPNFQKPQGPFSFLQHIAFFLWASDVTNPGYSI